MSKAELIQENRKDNEMREVRINLAGEIRRLKAIKSLIENPDIDKEYVINAINLAIGSITDSLETLEFNARF